MMRMATSKRGPRLTKATAEQSEWSTIYGVGSILQVSPTQAVIIANRRVVGMSTVDLEDGADAILIDSLDTIGQGQVLPLVRTCKGVHARTGEPLNMIAHLLTGGFVPLGAQRSDGTPHPAAGTGFALAHYFGNTIPKAHDETHRPDRGDQYQTGELLQLKFDGSQLSISDREPYEERELIPDFYLTSRALNNAIPDGDDMIGCLVGGPIENRDCEENWCLPTDPKHAHHVLGNNIGCGFCRWTFDGSKWTPHQFVPVTPPDLTVEPTLIRDVNGDLLMSVRQNFKIQGIENTRLDIRVYRSSDQGATWDPCLHKKNARSNAPIILSQSLSGTPYLVGNQCEQGKRDLLWLWPLNEDRTATLDPMSLMDGERDIGPARPFSPPFAHLDNSWYIDHCIGHVIRLADQQWHNLLCFRAIDLVTHRTKEAPGAAEGLWIEAFVEDASCEAVYPWAFSEDSQANQQKEMV